MKGYIDFIGNNEIRGWAVSLDDYTRDVKIIITYENEILLESKTGIFRDDVNKALGIDGSHGFHLKGISLKNDQLGKIKIQASLIDGSDRLTLPKARGGVPQYQSFDEVRGASDSQGKLARLQLNKIPNRYSESTPLKGLKVLDLGCNEGFFCGEALKQGASTVLGVDSNSDFIKKAKERFPRAHFLCRSWWDLPKEKFDVIILLSSIHYEKEQKKFFDMIDNHLSPEGTLVLECGIGRTEGLEWETIERYDGIFKFPTFQLLSQELMHNFTIRHIGESVPQRGDPLPRHVFHCNHKSPMALIIYGEMNIGKSTLGFQIKGKGVPVIHTDVLIGQILTDAKYQSHPVFNLLNKHGGHKKMGYGDLGLIIAKHAPNEFAQALCSVTPIEEPLFCIEGEILRHQTIRAALKDILKNRGVRFWGVTTQ